LRSPYAGRAGRVLRHAGPAAGLGLEPQAPAAAPGSGRTWTRSCVVVGEPARARGCVGGVLRLASASGMGRNPKGRGSAPGRGQSAGQSCGSTTAKGRAPVALQLRRAPPVFCLGIVLPCRPGRQNLWLDRPAVGLEAETAWHHPAITPAEVCKHVSHVCNQLRCHLPPHVVLRDWSGGRQTVQRRCTQKRPGSHPGRASWPFERTHCAALRRAASSSAAAGRSAPRATSISEH